MSSVATGTGRLSSAPAANGPEALAPGRLDAHPISGVLTHDLNNLLGVILGATERLAAQLGDGGEPRKLALLALEAAERGADLLRRALASARDDAPELTAIDCGDTLET